MQPEWACTSQSEAYIWADIREHGEVVYLRFQEDTMASPPSDAYEKTTKYLTGEKVYYRENSMRSGLNALNNCGVDRFRHLEESHCSR